MSDEQTLLPEELRRFYQHLIYCSQFRRVRVFQTGSSIEIPGNELSIQVCGVQLDSLDIDYMLYELDSYAFPCGQRVPADYGGRVLRIESNGVHPGYARLIDESDNNELAYPMYSAGFGKMITRHGPALQLSKTSQNRMLHGSATPTQSSISQGQEVQREAVSSVHCPFWPPEAQEWLTRSRPNGFPPMSVIKQIARYGCDFVGVQHKHSTDINEWRFSFSHAELPIVRSWTSPQRAVYRAIRLINKFMDQMTKRCPEEFATCSYYFKTLMLWACEQRPKEFWDVSVVIESVQQLLNEMAEWLVSKTCRNYFMPANNVMDHLGDIDVSSSVEALRCAATSPDLIKTLFRMCAKEESFVSGLTYATDMLPWIYNSLLIQDQLQNFTDNHGHLRSTYESYPTKLLDIFHEALSNIYKALTIQINCSNHSVASVNTQSCHCEKLLQSAINLWQPSSGSRNLVDINVATSLIDTLFMECGANHIATEALTPQVAQEDETTRQRSSAKCYVVTDSDHHSMLYVRRERPHVESTAERSRLEDTTFTVHVVSHTGARSVKFYRYWPGRSPTVSVSWFIAKAYLANFYFANRQDYKATVATCNEIIVTYSQSLGNQWFADCSFLVEVSTRWAGIYDRNLQALLGLCSLCAFVSSRSSRSVNSGVPPIQFARYLKLLSMEEQDVDAEVRIVDEWDVYEAVHRGSILLEASRRIALKK